MKIEMFEKVGEIEIVELRSAAENKAIAEIEMARKAEEERLRKEAEERKNDEIAVNIATHLVKEINEEAEKGHTQCTRYALLNSPIYQNKLRVVENRLNKIFDPLGYRIFIHEYSNSYQKKINEWGYITIFWD